MNININNLICSIDDAAFLYHLNKNIYKLDTPPITSMFFVKNSNDWYIVDTGASEKNFQKYIIPAMKVINLNFDDIIGIFITHNHWDHIGGLSSFLKYCKNAIIYGFAPNNKFVTDDRYIKVSDNDTIYDIFKVVYLNGHSDDSLGFIDARTNTLFSGDAIQFYGTLTAGMYIFSGIENYIYSLNKLKSLNIENILTSHPFSPLGAYAVGNRNSKEYIEKSISCIEELIDFISKEYSLGTKSVEIIKKDFISHNKKIYDDFPSDGFDCAIKSIIKEFNIY